MEYVGGLNNSQKQKKTMKNPKCHFFLGHPVLMGSPAQIFNTSLDLEGDLN